MATPKASYKPDRKGIEAMLKDPRMAKMCEQAANAGKTYAEGIAPRVTGNYAAGFEVETALIGTRQTAVLLNKTKYATVVETRHHVLARTIDRIKP
jgi:phage terminase large subunit-like protein